MRTDLMILIVPDNDHICSALYICIIRRHNIRLALIQSFSMDDPSMSIQQYRIPILADSTIFRQREIS
jgi:hypothetical protein